MTKNSLIQSESFADYCVAFEKLVKNYAILNKEKNVFFFFKTQSDIGKVLDSISSLINRITFSIYFPLMPSSQKLYFTEQCQSIHSDINKILLTLSKDDKETATLILQFSQDFSDLLKETLSYLWSGDFPHPNQVNLNYLVYYLDALSSGFDCPKNWTILKEEALTIIASYIASSPDSPIVILAKPILDSIRDDEHGINQHAVNHDERFYNILKLLDTLRQALIEKQETKLSMAITRTIENALEIAKPFSINSHHLATISSIIIQKQLNSLENQVSQKLLI